MHGVTPQSLWPQELHLSCNDFIAQVLQRVTIENQKSPVYVVHRVDVRRQGFIKKVGKILAFPKEAGEQEGSFQINSSCSLPPKYKKN